MNLPGTIYHITHKDAISNNLQILNESSESANIFAAFQS